MRGTPEHSRRVRLNRGRRFTEEERAWLGKIVHAYRPLVRRELGRLPDWIRRRHRDEAEELLLVELMWSALDFDPARCGGEVEEGEARRDGTPPGRLGAYLSMRLQYAQMGLRVRFAKLAKSEARLSGLPPGLACAGTRDVQRLAEDSELAEAAIAREIAADAVRQGRNGPGRVGPVLEERYLMGFTLGEIAARRGVTREAVRQAVERAVTRERRAVGRSIG